jgi:hypothetical protein
MVGRTVNHYLGVTEVVGCVASGDLCNWIFRVVFFIFSKRYSAPVVRVES